jgi:ribA/ribD-fused uncharacterized protein
LLNNITTYNIKDVVVFHKTAEAFGGLSNMAPNYIVQVNSINFFTIEHLYQACKFPLFPNVQEEIINERSPITCKQISRKYNHLVRQDWVDIQVSVMEWALQIKLSQNWDKFSSLLLSTSDKPIVEYTMKDKIWGAKPEGTILVGKNILGKLLTKLRDYYVPMQHQPCVQSPAITALILYNHVVETACVEPLLQEFYLETAC